MQLQRCGLTCKIEPELSQVLVLLESAKRALQGQREKSSYPALPNSSCCIGSRDHAEIGALEVRMGLVRHSAGHASSLKGVGQVKHTALSLHCSCLRRMYCLLDIEQHSSKVSLGAVAIRLPLLGHSLLFDNPDVVKHNRHNLLDVLKACMGTGMWLNWVRRLHQMSMHRFGAALMWQHLKSQEGFKSASWAVLLYITMPFGLGCRCTSRHLPWLEYQQLHDKMLCSHAYAFKRHVQPGVSHLPN